MNALVFPIVVPAYASQSPSRLLAQHADFFFFFVSHLKSSMYNGSLTCLGPIYLTFNAHYTLVYMTVNAC